MDYTPTERRILKSVERAQAECLERLRAKLPDSGMLTPRALLALMIADYEGTAIPGCDREQDGDMLLAQWGTYDFFGEPEYHFDVTRQFTVTAFEDGPMSQLQMTLRYTPRDDRRYEGNLWSHSHPTLESFRQAVEEQPGFRVVADAAAPKLSMERNEV